MPNWVISNLTVTGPKDKVVDFAESLIYKEDDVISLHEILEDEGIDPKQIDDKTFFQYYNKALFGEYNLPTGKEKVGFDRLIPKPQEVKIDLQLVKLPEGFKWDLYSDGWCGWNCANWGSKWGMCDVDINHYKALVDELKESNNDNLTFNLQYTSAWSPSTKAFEKISEIYKELEFTCTYKEEFGLFFIKEVYSNGKTIENFSADTGAKWCCYINDDFEAALDNITCGGDEEIIEEMLKPNSYLMQDVVVAAQSFYSDDCIVSSVDKFIKDFNVAPNFKDRFLETMGHNAMC